ncbi:unnamed protein product [Meloidogyne enterolobii]|uniref:Uncharacterized protein n=1 Tax=Meloidogyne enterolobii TaxID=390850 RepID=A0ACB1B0U8_MELEN
MKLNFMFLIFIFIFLFMSYPTKAHFYVPWYLSGNVENRLTFLERQTNQKINMLIARIETLEREVIEINKYF